MDEHYTPDEIGQLWKLSPDTVRRLFESEPGVLVIESSHGIGRKRRYRTLRIPAAVVERVHRRLQNPAVN